MSIRTNSNRIKGVASVRPDWSRIAYHSDGTDPRIAKKRRKCLRRQTVQIGGRTVLNQTVNKSEQIRIDTDKGEREITVGMVGKLKVRRIGHDYRNIRNGSTPGLWVPYRPERG